ncbi:glycosyltransferase family 2 protein [bacterium]|nr:glycosyltransferase family 2 protein [bacterium]
MVNIVIPIYGQSSLLLELWTSICKNTAPGLVNQIILVNDSPSDTESVETCQSISLSECDFEVKVILNEENLGFPESCNRAFEESNSVDVVIVNSDTLVFSGWLEGLWETACKLRSEGRLFASITPCTNNGTIATVPLENRPYDRSPAQDFGEAVSKLLSRIGKKFGYFEMPVGIGFCMLMSKEGLEAEGGFDPIFSPGYGEEVDWCLRCGNRGLSSFLCPSVFVYHHGGASFGSLKSARQEENEKIVCSRFPDYHESVRRYLEEQPTRGFRTELGHYWLVLNAISGASSGEVIEFETEIGFFRSSLLLNKEVVFQCFGQKKFFKFIQNSEDCFGIKIKTSDPR